MNYSLLVLAPLLARIVCDYVFRNDFFEYCNSNYVFKTKIKKELTQ